MLGFGHTEREPGRSAPINYNAPAPRPAQAEKNGRRAFCIALSWKGLFGLIALFIMLEIWMFLFGMWAAQTIVFPTPQHALQNPAAKTARKVEKVATVDMGKDEETALPGEQVGPVRTGQNAQRLPANRGKDADKAKAQEPDDGVFRGEAPPSW